MISLRTLRATGLSQLMRTAAASVRQLGASGQGDFHTAQERVKLLSRDPGNEAKLRLYALFKQATLGACDGPKPGIMEFVAKAKWTEWKALGGMTQGEAASSYVTYVQELVSRDSEERAESTPTDPTDSVVYSTVDSYAEIRLNRPGKYNAITWDMYGQIGELLERASREDVKFAVIRGTGEYYSSGNDLGNFANIPPEGPQKMAKDGEKVLRKFVASFIDFDKPLIAVVNGPAVGIPVTTLGLCDIVFAKDTATFHTPFTSLGQTPEACSSYTFPLIMGPAQANEILLFGRKLTAVEAFHRSLVTMVIPSASFETEVASKLREYSALPPVALRASKQLIRGRERDKLHEINSRECAELAERWVSDECISAVMKFFQRKQ